MLYFESHTVTAYTEDGDHIGEIELEDKIAIFRPSCNVILTEHMREIYNKMVEMERNVQ